MTLDEAIELAAVAAAARKLGESRESARRIARAHMERMRRDETTINTQTTAASPVWTVCWPDGSIDRESESS